MATILIKKRDTTGAPGAGDLTNSTGGAELAVNTFDKKLYSKDSGGNVVVVGSSLDSPLAVVGNSSAGAEIRLPEDTDNGSNYVALKAPNSISSNVTFTLPDADGTNGQVLITNGSGALSWFSAGTGDVTLTGTQTLTNKTLENPTITNGYTEETYSANSSTAITIDLANGTVQTITLTGNATITFPSNTAGKSFLMILKQDGTGSRTVTWDTDVKWPSSTAPTITATASKADIFSFVCDGTYWYGVTVGQLYL